MKKLVYYETKKHASFWRMLMEGRPWDSNSQQGMSLNYLLTVLLQRRMGQKQMYQKDTFLWQTQVLLYVSVSEAVWSNVLLLSDQPPNCTVRHELLTLHLNFSVPEWAQFGWQSALLAVSAPECRVWWHFALQIAGRCEQGGFMVAGAWLCPRALSSLCAACCP